MSKRRSKGAGPESVDVPYTMMLPDRRTVFVLIPGAWCGRDRDGGLTFKPEAVRLLDRVKALAMNVPKAPTPGFIRTLREALGLTQTRLGELVGVDKMTVYRWERGLVKPSEESVQRLRAVADRAARRGVVLAR